MMGRRLDQSVPRENWHSHRNQKPLLCVAVNAVSVSIHHKPSLLPQNETIHLPVVGVVMSVCWKCLNQLLVELRLT